MVYEFVQFFFLSTFQLIALVSWNLTSFQKTKLQYYITNTMISTMDNNYKHETISKYHNCNTKIIPFM